MVTAEQLRTLHIGPEWVDPLNETFQRFGIETARQQAAFIGQCGHECGNFKVLEENLNYRAATLIELLHTATLVHDDVVDDSNERRGFFSLNALWKNKIAVLVGDFLLSKGFFCNLKPILSKAFLKLSNPVNTISLFIFFMLI